MCNIITYVTMRIREREREGWSEREGEGVRGGGTGIAKEGRRREEREGGGRE